MEAVINNTKLIRRVNIFALLILAVCVCAVAFLCKNMWLHSTPPVCAVKPDLFLCSAFGLLLFKANPLEPDWLTVIELTSS